jgi:PLP dependent protein
MKDKKSFFTKRSLESLKRSIEPALLLAVSKGRSIQEIEQLYQWGVRDFGENRVHELQDKKSLLPKDIQWHFIGSLQRNKAKKIAGEVALIHSIDSLDLAKEISKVAQQKTLVQPCLLQVNISGEKRKHGLCPEEIKQGWYELKELKGIEWKGLMTMAPLTEDQALIRSTFRGLKKLGDFLGLKELSMGMSQDYKVALEEGATIVRLGRLVFDHESV